MEILASHELEVDLSMWRPEARVRLITPGAVSVGHIADELVRFLNLPNEAELSRAIVYSLAPPTGGGDGAVAAFDREHLVAEVEHEGALALVSNKESLVEQVSADVTEKINAKVDELEAEIRAKINDEIDRWMEKGRSLVIGAFDDAMDQVRAKLPAEIAKIVPKGGAGVVAQFRGSRTVKEFMVTQTRPAYDGAVRTGLAMARRSSGAVLRWLGTVAASLGGGGVAGAGAGIATGAAAGAGSGASSGASAGAAAGLVVAGAALAAASIGPNPVQWFVNPSGAGAITDENLAGTGSGNDLLLDLDSQTILIRDESGESVEWVPLAWPGVTAEVPDHSHPDDDEHIHEGLYSASDHNHQTRIEAGVAAPDANNGADFFVNRCTGVLWGNDDQDGWRPLVELSLIDAAAFSDACGPHTIRRGQSLWSVVREVCGPASNAELGREANRTWLANLGVIGSDPNALPAGETVAVKCESG